MRTSSRGPTMSALLLVCVYLLGLSNVVQAAEVSLSLSDFVSDGPVPPNVNDLNATLTFSLDASPIALPTVLTFTFSNDTAVPTSFRVDEIDFNMPDNVDSVSLTANPGNKWMASLDNLPGAGFMVNGFGKFDLQLIDAPGNGVARVNSGQSVIFGLTLSGTGTISVTDFVSEFSEPPPGDIPMLAAAKFVQGPNGESGFGATNVPEPATIAFVAIGALFLRRRRSR